MSYQYDYEYDNNCRLCLKKFPNFSLTLIQNRHKCQIQDNTYWIFHKACRAQISAVWCGEVVNDPWGRGSLCSWCSVSFCLACKIPQSQWSEARKVSQEGLTRLGYLEMGERILFCFFIRRVSYKAILTFLSNKQNLQK